MTELEKAIMGEMPETEEISEDVDLTEEAEEIPEELTEEDEALKESFIEVQKMKKEIEEENNRLNIKFAEVKIKQQEKSAPRRRYHYIGTLSAAASLILMGTAMTFSLFSPTGVLSSLKLAPLMLVFLGIEIFLAIFRNHSVRIRYNAKSLILTVLLIAVSFIMSVISVNNSVTGGERYYAEERLQNMLERQMSIEFSEKLVKDVDIKIHLYGDDPSDYENIKDLKDSDVIDLEIHYIDAQVTMYEFASNCRKLMDGLLKMPYNFGTVKFIANDDINSFTMDVNWLYQSDFAATELIPLINYFGNDIVMDIPDLVEAE